MLVEFCDCSPDFWPFRGRGDAGTTLVAVWNCSPDFWLFRCRGDAGKRSRGWWGQARGLGELQEAVGDQEEVAVEEEGDELQEAVGPQEEVAAEVKVVEEEGAAVHLQQNPKWTK